MKVNLKSITPDVETTLVEIARVSSSRKNKRESPEGLINYLIKNKHWSPFEHGYMTMEIVTSKPIAIQFLRHVSFRFQEFSQRYAEVTNIEPIQFRLQAEENRQSSTTRVGMIIQRDDASLDAYMDEEFMRSFEGQQDIRQLEGITKWLALVANNMEETLTLYKEGLELGIAKETARFILPLASQTTLYMSGTIRSWIHMLDIRDDAHAQLEIQIIAREMKKIFIKELPIISKARGYENIS